MACAVATSFSNHVYEYNSICRKCSLHDVPQGVIQRLSTLEIPQVGTQVNIGVEVTDVACIDVVSAVRG